MTLLKSRTRIVQLAIATVALAAMTLGGSFTAQAGTPGGLDFNAATGVLVYDAGTCSSDNPATTPGVETAVPAGNGAFASVLFCTDGTLMSAIFLPAPGPANGVVAINGATTVVAVTVS